MTLLSADLSRSANCSTGRTSTSRAPTTFECENYAKAIANELCGTVSPVGGVVIQNKTQSIYLVTMTAYGGFRIWLLL